MCIIIFNNVVIIVVIKIVMYEGRIEFRRSIIIIIYIMSIIYIFNCDFLIFLNWDIYKKINIVIMVKFRLSVLGFEIYFLKMVLII